MREPYHILNALLGCAGGPGDEAKCLTYIAQYAEPYADELWRDAIGNLIIQKKGAGRRVMLSAGCDIYGFHVYSVDEKGFLHVIPLGNIHAGSLPGARVRFQNGIYGVVCAAADDRAEKRKMKDMSIRHDLYIDIGASGKQEVLEKVSLGDIAILDGEAASLAGERLLLPGAASLIGPAILIIAMQELQHPVNDVYFVFAAQGNLGRRGANMAEHRLSPDIGLDIGIQADRSSVSGLGQGGLVGAHLGNSWYADKIIQLAMDQGICCETFADAAPQADLMHSAPWINLAIPVRGMNTPTEIIDLRDVTAAARLVVLAANTVWEDKNDAKAV